MTTSDIVAKLWNLCNILKDDGVTYHQYVTELTYLLFLKMAKETGTEDQLPADHRWADLEARAAPERLEFYKILLIHLGSHGSTLVQEIFANASSFIKKPATLSTLVAEIDKIDWYSVHREDLGDLYEGLLEKNANPRCNGPQAAGARQVSIAVVDTNVVLVANGQHDEVSPECAKACVLALQGVMRSGKLVLDDGFRILLEYQKETQPKKGNRPGDAFVKWALNNRCNVKSVEQVTLREHDALGFESFPDDADLANFDASDRKFVAASGAHPDKPPIAQAADSKWLNWAPALHRHGIEVNFLCDAEIRRFHKNKFGA